MRSGFKRVHFRNYEDDDEFFFERVRTQPPTSPTAPLLSANIWNIACAFGPPHLCWCVCYEISGAHTLRSLYVRQMYANWAVRQIHTRSIRIINGVFCVCVVLHARTVHEWMADLIGVSNVAKSPTNGFRLKLLLMCYYTVWCDIARDQIAPRACTRSTRVACSRSSRPH